MISSNFAVALVIGIILLLAGWRIWQDYKRPDKCAGCPYAGSCSMYNQKDADCSEREDQPDNLA